MNTPTERLPRYQLGVRPPGQVVIVDTVTGATEDAADVDSAYAVIQQRNADERQRLAQEAGAAELVRDVVFRE